MELTREGFIVMKIKGLRTKMAQALTPESLNHFGLSIIKRFCILTTLI